MDWNVVVTLHPESYGEAKAILGPLGRVERTEFFNVLVMEVADPRDFLSAFAEQVEREPGTLNFISHVVPAEAAFNFTSPESFEAKGRDIALGWVDRLRGQTFHVRMHRRGFKGRLLSPKEEQFLDHVLLEALAAADAPGRITFDDPDAIIAVETVGNRAGLSLWTRDDLRRYPFLGLD